MVQVINKDAYLIPKEGALYKCNLSRWKAHCRGLADQEPTGYRVNSELGISKLQD